MEATREEMIAEAVARMKELGIFSQTIEQFRRSGKVSISEGKLGSYFWADEETQKKIKEIEDENGGIVYTGIRHFLYDDECIAFLWVTKHKEDWQYDKDDMKSNIVFAYVWNKGCDMNSEFGSIKVALTVGGGLRRIA